MTRADWKPQATAARIYCPRCRRATKESEWRVILRRVLGSEQLPPLRVLELVTCETLVYFLLQ